MAIINAPGTGFDVLIETLLRKEQLAQQKEALKLDQQRTKIEQERFNLDRVKAKEQEQAGMALLQTFLKQNPELQRAAQGLTGAAGTEFVQNFQALQQSEAQLGLVDVQTRAQAEELRQNQDLFGLRKRAEEARISASEAQTAESRANVAFLDTQLRVGALESAQRQVQNFGELAGAIGNPAAASRILFGSDTPPSLSALADEQLALVNGSKSADEAISARLTRASGIFGLDETNISELRKAFQATDNPQEIVNQIYAQKDLDDESKSILFGVVQSVFPDARLSVPEKERGALARFFRNFRFGTLTTERASGERPAGASTTIRSGTNLP